MPGRPAGTRDIQPSVRVAVVLFLTQHSVAGMRLKGAVKKAAVKFGIGRASVAKIWGSRADVPALLAPPRANRPPRPRRLTRVEVAQRVAAVSLCQRQTLESLARAAAIPKTTLWRHLRDGALQRVVQHVNPTLTEIHRLHFALSHVQRPIDGRLYRMHHMYDVVHIDIKWFNLYKASSKFYISPNEPLPYRSAPNKRYIGKVMFLTAVARPRYNYRTKQPFDGKTGIWPIFLERTPALRSSANRPAGTMVTKNVNMTRSVYTRMLKEEVFPAIRSKWPGRKNAILQSQQDNAGPHVAPDNADIVKAGEIYSWRIEMTCKPPRSPDMNVFDLGVFSSLQDYQYQRDSHDRDSLITAVNGAFERIPASTIDKVFVTLQKVMQCVIASSGGNDYRLPRVRKEYYRGDIAPTSLPIKAEVVDDGFKVLSQMISS